ncbi:PA2928 family protein [Hymenobacter psoromatis]|uniref:PA2928 family protein n=1 Tax=Hymenobacter psoromatis TaxID=1484116 RepID=UPI001CBB2402|nr:PA2928 family protein [Hymenobacter psoromatis]
MQPTSTPGSPLLGLLRFLLLLLPAGLIYALVSWGLNATSSTYLQPDALFYQSQGQTVVASVMTRFQAYSTGSKGTYGSDRVYAAAFALATGQQLWQVRLDAPDERGHDMGGAALLGQSARYLFFYRNQLYVLDKQTGKVVAQNADFPAIAAHLSKAIVMDYTDAGPYRYNDTLQAVLATGTDGLYYAIDGQTLQAHAYTPAPAQRLTGAGIAGRREFNNEYDEQITEVSDDGRQCLALLDDQDAVLLAHQGSGVAERSGGESKRRHLYRASSDNRGNGWAALSPSVFLFGGFLTDPARPLQQPADSISKLRAYQSLLDRYASPYAPLRLPGGGFLVMHRATIESQAPIQLTAMSGAGQVRWHVETDYANFALLHADPAATRLYLLGSRPGRFSDRLEQVLSINLQTGQTSQYKVKEGFSLW